MENENKNKTKKRSFKDFEIDYTHYRLSGSKIVKRIKIDW